VLLSCRHMLPASIFKIQLKKRQECWRLVLCRWKREQKRPVYCSLHVCFSSLLFLMLHLDLFYLCTMSFVEHTSCRLAADIQFVSMKVNAFRYDRFFALTDTPQFISQSPSNYVLAMKSRIPTVLSMVQVLPSVQVVSQNEPPPSSCFLPHVIPSDSATECMVCRDGQLLTVSRSSGKTKSVYYRVVFHGSTCGPWVLLLHPTAPDSADRNIGKEKLLRITSAEYTSVMFLPAPGPVLYNIMAERRSSQSARALHLRSLAAAAAAFADFPAASSFDLSHKPSFTNLAENLSPMALRSHIVVDSNRPLLVPGRVSWHLSSDVVVVPYSTIPCYEPSTCCVLIHSAGGRVSQILLFTDNMISSSVHVALYLSSFDFCSVSPSVLSVEGGTYLEQSIFFKDCHVQGNSTLRFVCGGCAAEQLRVTVVCP
jgi:hypothetical protein